MLPKALPNFWNLFHDPRVARRAHGEGTLYQRAEGLWVTQLRLPTGERRTPARERARFHQHGGAGMEAGVVNDNVSRLLNKADLPHLTDHDLRPTVATILLQRGAHPKLVQDLLGRSTVTLTLDTYSHVAPALHLEATRRLDEVMSARKGDAARLPATVD